MKKPKYTKSLELYQQRHNEGALRGYAVQGEPQQYILTMWIPMDFYPKWNKHYDKFIKELDRDEE